MDSGDGESDLERPRHQLAVIDGIAHWKSMGFEAGGSSRIPNNAGSRTGPCCAQTQHPDPAPTPGVPQGPLGLVWESLGVWGRGGAMGSPPRIPAWVPTRHSPPRSLHGGPAGHSCPPASLYEGTLGDAPTQHPHMGIPQGTAPQNPCMGALKSTAPQNSCMGVPQGMVVPWNPCTGVLQGTAPDHPCMGVPQVTITPGIPTRWSCGQHCPPASPQVGTLGDAPTQHPTRESLGSMSPRWSHPLLGGGSHRTCPPLHWAAHGDGVPLPAGLGYRMGCRAGCRVQWGKGRQWSGGRGAARSMLSLSLLPSSFFLPEAIKPV